MSNGPMSPMDAIQARLEREEAITERLNISSPEQSPAVADVLDEYDAVIGGIASEVLEQDGAEADFVMRIADYRALREAIAERDALRAAARRNLDLRYKLGAADPSDTPTYNAILHDVALSDADLDAALALSHPNNCSRKS